MCVYIRVRHVFIYIRDLIIDAYKYIKTKSNAREDNDIGFDHLFWTWINNGHSGVTSSRAYHLIWLNGAKYGKYAFNAEIW